jgi:hypothetical protein
MFNNLSRGVKVLLVFIALAVVAGIAGAISGGEAPPAANPTVTVPAPEPEPTTEPEPEPEPTVEPVEVEEPTTPVIEEEATAWDSSDYDTTMLVMELTWADTDLESRESICWGVNNLGVDWAVDEMSAASDEQFNREAMVDFFTEKCS